MANTLLRKVKFGLLAGILVAGVAVAADESSKMSNGLTKQPVVISASASSVTLNSYGALLVSGSCFDCGDAAPGGMNVDADSGDAGTGGAGATATATDGTATDGAAAGNADSDGVSE